MKKLLVPLLALGFLLGAETTLADRDGYDKHRGNDRGYERDWRNNGNGWGRRDKHRRPDYRSNDHHDTDLSISLSFGNIVRGSHGAPLIRHNDNFGISSWSSYRPSWSAPRSIPRQRQHAPVVIYQNNYNINTRANTRRESPTGRVPGYAGSSLLRDVQGRCFERDYDSRGNETRRELPASACRF